MSPETTPAPTQAIDPNLAILVVLDSPQLDGLAPELTPLRAKATKVAEGINTARCSSCAKRSAHRALLAIAVELRTLVASNPSLQRVIGVLQTAAAQPKAALT
jgi:hypothetical protein